MPQATSKKDISHARFYGKWKHLPAWKFLSGSAFKVLISVMSDYRPKQPNEFKIPLSMVRDIAMCSQPTAKKILDELEDKGWIRCERIGGMKGPKDKRASMYSLTMFPSVEHPVAPKDFEKWKPQ